MNGKAHSVKPVIKWAGGKTQLLDTIDSFLPQEVKNGEISRYIEPFVGGGAVFAYFICLHIIVLLADLFLHYTNYPQNKLYAMFIFHV